MKRKVFVGFVNGKSFDNEKDFNDAASKAMESNDDVLSISSYYKEVDVDETEKKPEIEDTKEEVKDTPKVENPMKPEEYVLSNKKNYDAWGYIYNVDSTLKSRLKEITNSDEVLNTCKDKIKELMHEIDDSERYSKETEKEIEELQDRLYKIEDSIKDMRARKKYYNCIIDIIEHPEKYYSYLPMRYNRYTIFDDILNKLR